MLLSSSIRSWPQLGRLFISVSFVALALIYFSSAGAELITRNHVGNELQSTMAKTTASRGTTGDDNAKKYKSMQGRAESSSSQFNSNLLLQTRLFTFTFPLTQDPPQSPGADASYSTFPSRFPSATATSTQPRNDPISPNTNLNSRLWPRIKRSYIKDYQDQGITTQSQTTQPHHRLRHEQKLNNKAIMNKNGGSGSGSGGLGGSDCVNNSFVITKPKKTSYIPPEECYHKGDVLIVVAITCLLNFSFVLVLWASVRWINYRPRKWYRRKNSKRSRIGYKRRKWEREKSCCWDEMDKSDSSSSEEEEDYDEDDDELLPNSQDNLIVKSYSMEELRFYHG